MITITYKYNHISNLIQTIARSMGDIVKDNTIKGDNFLYTGIHKMLSLENELSAIIVDVTYHDNAIISHRTNDSSMLGLCFYITNKDLDFNLNLNHVMRPIGQLNYNMSLMDMSIPTDYIVKKGTSIYAICIFNKRTELEKYLHKTSVIEVHKETVLDQRKNTIIRMGRMSNESRNFINEFRKISYDSPSFEMYFKGVVYGLISNYLQEIGANKVVIGKVIGDDLKHIISSKRLLLNLLEEQFPGIDFLAEKVSMPPTKYKKLFSKITGSTPGEYFSKNKLHLAKELLESGKYTVNEVAEKLHYRSISYFSKRFKETYGIFPKEYQSTLLCQNHFLKLNTNSP